MQHTFPYSMYMYVHMYMYVCMYIGTMSRKSKTVFSIEETSQLVELFNAGLDSISKEKSAAIKDAALKLKKTEQEIKVHT